MSVAGRRRNGAGSRQLERERAFALARLEGLVDHAPIGIALLDGDLRFREVNSQLLAIGGGTAEDRIGRRLSEVNPGLLPVEEALQAMLENGEPPPALTVAITTLDGESRTVLASAYPIPGEDGEIESVGVIAVDVTERERAAAALAQAEKLETLATLAGGIAHDFNNLLAVVVGFADLLQRRLPDDLAVFAREIETAARKGAALVEQMLAFGKNRALEPRVLDLNDLIRELEPMLHRLAGSALVGLELDPAPQLVHADPQELERVLINLAANARDAMAGQGSLRIRTRTVVPAPELVAKRDLEAGPHVLLEVADTGCGMDETTLARAFEPFFTTKPAGNGTGLGLASVQAVVEERGGAAELASEPGRGTTVSVYLPVAVVGADAPAGPEPVFDRARHGTTVLVVDDEEPIRRAMAHMLEEGGYRVVAAGSGAEALAAAAEDEIDVLVTDITMPSMSGPSLVAELRRQRPGLKVVFVSASADETTRGLPATDPILRKPFRGRELRGRVGAAVGALAAQGG